MDKKSMCAYPFCKPTEPRPLSDEAAVEIHEFLETFASDFMAQYGHQIYRYYDSMRCKRNFVDAKPWISADADASPF